MGSNSGCSLILRLSWLNCECIVLKRLTSRSVYKSLKSYSDTWLSCICHHSRRLLCGRLSPGLICECRARPQYLERSNTLTNLFCYFRDNTREFPAKYMLQLFPLLHSNRRWLKRHVRNGFAGYWCWENPQAALDPVLTGSCWARTFLTLMWLRFWLSCQEQEKWLFSCAR